MVPSEIFRSKAAFALFKAISQGRDTMRQLVKESGMAQPQIARHLKMLEEAGIISAQDVRQKVGRPIKKYGALYSVFSRLSADFLYQYFFHVYPHPLKKGRPIEKEYELFCSSFGIRDAPALPKVQPGLLFKRLFGAEQVRRELEWFLRRPNVPQKTFGDFLVWFYEGLVRFSRSQAKVALPKELLQLIDEIESSRSFCIYLDYAPDVDFHAQDK